MKKYILLIFLFSLIILPNLVLAQDIPAPVRMSSFPAGQIPLQPVDPQIAPRSTTYTLFCGLEHNPKVGDLFTYATCIISSAIIPLIMTLAVAMFLWGVVQYVINAQEEAKRQKGRDFMIWGIIALAVMVSVWGLVKIVGNTFGVQNAIPSTQTNR